MYDELLQIISCVRATCQAFLARSGVDQSRMQVRDFFALGVFAVTMPVDAAPVAKTFWQHTGEVVSSRLASAVLDIVDETCYENAASTPPSTTTEGTWSFRSLCHLLCTCMYLAIHDHVFAGLTVGPPSLCLRKHTHTRTVCMYVSPHARPAGQITSPHCATTLFSPQEQLEIHRSSVCAPPLPNYHAQTAWQHSFISCACMNVFTYVSVRSVRPFCSLSLSVLVCTCIMCPRSWGKRRRRQPEGPTRRLCDASFAAARGKCGRRTRQ